MMYVESWKTLYSVKPDARWLIFLRGFSHWKGGFAFARLRMVAIFNSPSWLTSGFCGISGLHNLSVAKVVQSMRKSRWSGGKKELWFEYGLQIFYSSLVWLSSGSRNVRTVPPLKRYSGLITVRTESWKLTWILYIE